MRYFDSHAHYYDERFFGEEMNKESVSDLLDTLFKNDIAYIINVGTSPKTCRLAIKQARQYPNMYTALGIHPTDGQYLDDVDKAIDEIKALILDSQNKCVCLGEIGLDYHYPDTDREKQIYIFEKQLKLAEELNMPVSIHDRDAHGDVLDILKKHPDVRGILHSYSGSVEMARELVKMGYLISFSGTVSFTNAKKVVEVAKTLSKESVLIETDAPYLAPHPKRGTLNHSGNLVYTNRALAACLGISEEECASVTLENAKRIFSIN